MWKSQRTYAMQGGSRFSPSFVAREAPPLVVFTAVYRCLYKYQVTCRSSYHPNCTASSKHQKNNYQDPPFLMGKSTISMAMFNSYVKLPEGIEKKQTKQTRKLHRFTVHRAAEDHQTPSFSAQGDLIAILPWLVKSYPKQSHFIGLFWGNRHGYSLP